MNIDRIIWTPLERDIIARIVWTPLLIALTFLALLTSGYSQQVNDLVISRRIASSGREEKVFWRTGFTISGGLLTVTPPAIAGISGLQAALDGKVSLAGSYTNPDWLVSIPFSKITARPSTLTGYGITEFATEAFLLTPAVDSLDIGDEGLGWVDGRLTLQTDAGSLQWYQDGGFNIMAWSDRLQANSLDISAVSIFTAVPAGPTSAGEAGQIAFDGGYLYVCVALNTWLRAALGPWTP